MGSRLILSSGFTIRRACYARASWRRLGKRRRRDRRRANVFIAADISSDGHDVKGAHRSRQCGALEDCCPLKLSNALACPVDEAERKHKRPASAAIYAFEQVPSL